jgi:hypothetical protein
LPAPPPSDDALYEIREQRLLLLINRERLPEDDYAKLDGYLRKQERQAPWSLQLIHMTRWFHVKAAISLGYKTLDGSAFDYAAAECAGTPAAGGPAAMKSSFWWMKKRWRQTDTGYF